jgi:hypothetical protein
MSTMAKRETNEPDNTFPREVGNPARSALVVAGYTRLEQLDEVSEKYLLGLHGVGPKAIRGLKSALAEIGLSLSD